MNDINTHFINNIRLEVEHSIDWMNSEGSLLDFAYDKYLPIPSTDTTTNAGPLSGYQSSWGYKAPQGLAIGALNSSPVTNDFNEFGELQYGKFTVTTTTGGVITGFNGTAVTVDTGANGTISVTFPNGSIGYIPYTLTSAGTGPVTSIGGVPLTAGSFGIVAGTFTMEATGTSYDFNDPSKGNIITVPIGVTVTVTTGAVAINTIGGVAVGTTGTYTIPVQDQPGNRNPNYNQGYKDRVTIFQNTSSYSYLASGNFPSGTAVAAGGGHLFYYVAVIPNKLIHDFWMQLVSLFTSIYTKILLSSFAHRITWILHDRY